MAAPDSIPDLLKAVNDASGRAFALWVTFLTVGTYLAIAIGTTTHVQLLLEAPVKLPLLGVDLPLFAFYEFAPPLFLVLHLYVLVQLVMLSRSLLLFDAELQSAQVIQKDRERIRAQLDKFMFTQLLIGAPEGWLVRQFLRLMVWLSFAVAPLALLLAFQIKFLPYHSASTTWVHRVALATDVALLWSVWRRLSGSRTHLAWMSEPSRAVWRAFLVLGCAVLVVFSLGVATIPGERIETAEVGSGLLTHQAHKRLFWWPTWTLFEGEPDEVLSRTTSLLSRNLVLIDAQLVETDSDRLARLTRTLMLRGRDLRFAVLDRADLRKADLTGAILDNASLIYAQLQGASLDDAQLQNASLGSANLQRASLRSAQLQGASFEDGQLQGASLDGAQLQDASLDRAQLEGAGLNDTNLQGASLIGAHLQGTRLNRARLQGADFNSAELHDARLYRANLQGARFAYAQMQGVWLQDAELQGSNLDSANLQGAWLDGANLQGASLDETDLQGASLNGAKLQGASITKAQLQGADLRNVSAWRTSLADDDAYLVDARDLNLRPMSIQSISHLIDTVTAHVPEGLARYYALKGLARLTEDMPNGKEQALAARWVEIRDRGWDAQTNDSKLAGFLTTLSCHSINPPYVGQGLVIRLYEDWKYDNRPYAPVLAQALRVASCGGARGLTSNEMERLDAIIKEAGLGATNAALKPPQPAEPSH
jgi:uncharacterized protein YjbI with pentapeptide repeats